GCVLRGFGFEQLSRWSHGALGLPERGAAIVAESVQRADVGERDDLVAAKAGARDQVVERAEAPAFAPLALRRGGPVVRAVVAEPLRGIDLLEHGLIVAAALRTQGGGWGG